MAGKLGTLPRVSFATFSCLAKATRAPPPIPTRTYADSELTTMISDEPRRSGRSTKGQHKNLDMIPETPAKKTKAKAQAKEKTPKPSAEATPAPSEEEEIIRCICGEYEEEEDIERDMICCDKCSAWQHNDCMGLTFAKGEEPDQYFCEQCKPEDHKVLLEKMARGEKPWEEVAERRRKEAEEMKAARRRKGKKGRKGGRQSEVKAETTTPARNTGSRASATPSETPVAKAPTPAPAPAPPAAVTPTPASAPAPEMNNHVAEERRASSQKRKFSEHQEVPTPELAPKTKQQKVSPPGETLTPQPKKQTPARKESKAQAPKQAPIASVAATESARSIAELTIPARRNAANALSKVFVDQISDASTRGSFNLPEGKSGEEFGEQLGLSVENAMYQNLCGGSGEPTEAYKLQLRTVLFNVKKNPSLRDRLLVGSLLPEALSKMSSQDMASEELQQKDAEIKAEAERQHIIIQEQGPRIRRTHKGEEIVEDDQQQDSSEPVFSAAPRRATVTEANGSPSAQSPTSPAAKQPEIDGREKTPQEPTPNERPTTHDEHFPARGHSPGAGQEQVFPEVQTYIREPIPTGKVQADAEIDQLLKDDEPESPPYSPKEFHDEGAIWHGRVVMNPVSEFSSFAKHVGGADLSGRIPWGQLIPSTLLIDGRIDIQLASNYLCGLRFSSSTDVTVISISSPESPKEKAGFDKLFNYFQERKRYGVVGKHPLPAVKDTYLIPIEAGSKKNPEFIELLENNALEDPIHERILLVVFAVKTGESNPASVQPPSHHSSLEPTASASPLTVASATPQQTHFGTPGPRPTTQQQYAQTPTPAFTAATHGQQPPAQGVQFNSYQSPPVQNQASPIGLAAAIQVLGAQANTPSIQQLLQQAPNVTTTQLHIVRDILVRHPQAASDYKLLMNELYHATTSNGNGHAPAQTAQ
ncbi:transcription factor S-II, central domain-containing protein [Aspergillus granulosus]|uniref:Transcription factor BYE1 n=1 Tax=Aspergillus granulosus TaxID=176169 RepID=A0ABR4H7Q7_9EURO